MLGVHVRRVAVAQRLREELRQRLDAELPLVGVGLASAVLLLLLLMQLLLQLLLLDDGMVLLLLLLQELLLLLLDHLQAHVGGHGRVLHVTLAGVPDFERRAGRERVRVGLGDLGLGDLRGVDGDGQRGVDVGRRQEGLVLGVEVDGLEVGRRLAVRVVHHRVALVVISGGRVWTRDMTEVVVSRRVGLHVILHARQKKHTKRLFFPFGNNKNDDNTFY